MAKEFSHCQESDKALAIVYNGIDGLTTRIDVFSGLFRCLQGMNYRIVIFDSQSAKNADILEYPHDDMLRSAQASLSGKSILNGPISDLFNK